MGKEKSVKVGTRRRGWLRNLRLPEAATLTIVVLLVAAFLVLWITGRPEGGEWWLLHEKPLEWKDRLSIAGAVAAGAGAAVALVVSYRRQRDSEESKFAVDFAAATQQLGDGAAATRLAGVYALIHLAETDSGRVQQCLDVLCGYLRFPWPQLQESDGHPDNRAELEVRRTILRLIGEHLRPADLAALGNPTGKPHPSIYRKPGLASWSALSFDFTHARLPRFDWTFRLLKGELDFTGSIFTEPARFSWAQFAQHVHFDGSTFEDEAQFGSATFTDAGFGRCQFNGNASFTQARFAGQAWFEKAKFTGDTSFASARFEQDSNFSGTEFTGPASFARATFALETNPEVAAFSDAKFGSRAWFKECRFNGEAEFSGAQFEGSALFDEVVATWPISFRTARFVGEHQFGERPPPYPDETQARLSFVNAQIEQGLDLGAATIQCESDWTGTQIMGDLVSTFGVVAKLHTAPLVEHATLNGAPLLPEDLGWQAPD